MIQFRILMKILMILKVKWNDEMLFLNLQMTVNTHIRKRRLVPIGMANWMLVDQMAEELFRQMSLFATMEN